MPMGEFTNAGAEDALEKLREMFNAVPPAQRRDYLHQFSTIGTYIQASQRALRPLCGDTPNGDSTKREKENDSANPERKGSGF